MPLYSKESLEQLRQRVDLVELISSYVELKRSGALYKGLCPFHEERTPSFVVQMGHAHYHCFGCGAHGDAIAFLMQYSKLSFFDAVEMLARRYQVLLEKVSSELVEKQEDKHVLRSVLEEACRLYHYLLLHTKEGREALRYLEKRDFPLTWIDRFRLGMAPSEKGVIPHLLKSRGFSQQVMIDAGLLTPSFRGGWRELFAGRIVVPVLDGMGSLLGFSARRWRENSDGGKYVNTPETLLFKKSRILFGLDASRRRIVKERRAIIVEGQIDALRLIGSGLDLVVAAQGTAFGEGHLKEVQKLGVQEVYLAFDGDEAGGKAAAKVGDLFQREGISVRVVSLPEGKDPDSWVREKGIEAFLELLETSQEYLAFLVDHLKGDYDLGTPAGKYGLAQQLIRQIRSWPHPLMVHESIRSLAQLISVPQELLGEPLSMPSLYVKKSGWAGFSEIDPDKAMEGEFLRWLLLAGSDLPDLFTLAASNIDPEELLVPLCRELYETLLRQRAMGEPYDLLSLASAIEDPEAESFLKELMERKVDWEHAKPLFIATVQKLHDRSWMYRREKVRQRIESGHCSDEEALELLKQFAEFKGKPPQVCVTP